MLPSLWMETGDGAIKHKKSRNAGHRAGLNTVERIIEKTLNAKIKYLTLYTFSTENWKRPKNEIIFLFKLLENFLIKKTKDLIKSEIKLKILGDKKLFSNKLRKLLQETERKTSKNKKLQINLALNYGSKNEIISPIKIINKKNKTINQKNIEDNLYTKNIPNPDLLIRTRLR